MHTGFDRAYWSYISSSDLVDQLYRLPASSLASTINAVVARRSGTFTQAEQSAYNLLVKGVAKLLSPRAIEVVREVLAAIDTKNVSYSEMSQAKAVAKAPRFVYGPDILGVKVVETQADGSFRNVCRFQVEYRDGLRGKLENKIGAAICRFLENDYANHAGGNERTH